MCIRPRGAENVLPSSWHRETFDKGDLFSSSKRTSERTNRRASERATKRANKWTDRRISGRKGHSMSE